MPHIGNFPIPGYPKPVTVPPSTFVAEKDIHDWTSYTGEMQNRAALSGQYFKAPVYFPHGSTITRLTLSGFRDDAAATMELRLKRMTPAGSETILATLTADWVTEQGSMYTEVIAFPTVDNGSYAYYLELLLIPNDDVLDVRLRGAQVHWK